METIYLSLRAQVAVGTVFMKSPVWDLFKMIKVHEDNLVFFEKVYKKEDLGFLAFRNVRWRK